MAMIRPPPRIRCARWAPPTALSARWSLSRASMIGRLRRTLSRPRCPGWPASWAPPASLPSRCRDRPARHRAFGRRPGSAASPIASTGAARPTKESPSRKPPPLQPPGRCSRPRQPSGHSTTAQSRRHRRIHHRHLADRSLPPLQTVALRAVRLAATTASRSGSSKTTGCCSSAASSTAPTCTDVNDLACHAYNPAGRARPARRSVHANSSLRFEPATPPVSDPGNHESCPIPAGIQADLRVGGPSFIAAGSQLAQADTSLRNLIDRRAAGRHGSAAARCVPPIGRIRAQRAQL